MDRKNSWTCPVFFRSIGKKIAERQWVNNLRRRKMCGILQY